MQEEKNGYRNKGGRPQKQVKRNQHLAVKCSLLERKIIERKAGLAALTASEYLRELGLSGQAAMKIKVLPREVLQLSATLHHMAANLNQIAYRRNKGEELTLMERAGLNGLATEIRNLVKEIKAYLQ